MCITIRYTRVGDRLRAAVKLVNKAVWLRYREKKHDDYLKKSISDFERYV